MSEITVAVNGAFGRMGQTVQAAVQRESGMRLVGGADPRVDGSVADADGLTYAASLESLFGFVKPDVVVDFSNASGGEYAMRTSVAHGVRCVSGSTGIAEGTLSEIGSLAADAGVGVISASNFALGCVVLMHLAKVASGHFEYADIIESHHDQKVDSPSGTA